MQPRVRDLLIPAAAIVLIIVAVVFAFVLPALELQQVKKELEGSSTVSPTVVGTPSAPTVGIPGISGPPSFTLLVTPVEARSPPRGSVLYTLTIEPRGGFDAPITLRLDINALLLYRDSFDLGTIDPPFPRTFEYRFVVPGDVPSGTTVTGVLTGEGGGYTDSVDLVLIVT
jgi:hypothetical protein